MTDRDEYLDDDTDELSDSDADYYVEEDEELEDEILEDDYYALDEAYDAENLRRNLRVPPEES